MTKTQANVMLVLMRLMTMATLDEDDADCISDSLEDFLNELHGNDFFGTEGQQDPRGDFRNGKWTMENIEL